jgi:hypothetical protein
MPLEHAEHFSDLAAFQEIRAEYARLLETHPLEASKDGKTVLEQPLCQLWRSAYKRVGPSSSQASLTA